LKKERQDEWWLAHAQTLNLSLEEVAHIRSVLTKAELEVSHIYFFSTVYASCFSRFALGYFPKIKFVLSLLYSKLTRMLLVKKPNKSLLN
jgi:hypothetical protein